MENNQDQTTDVPVAPDEDDFQDLSIATEDDTHLPVMSYMNSHGVTLLDPYLNGIDRLPHGPDNHPVHRHTIYINLERPRYPLRQFPQLRAILGFPLSKFRLRKLYNGIHWLLQCYQLHSPLDTPPHWHGFILTLWGCLKPSL